MKMRFCAILVVAAACCALLLTSCGGAGGGFEGRVARDASECSTFFEAAMALADERQAGVKDTAEEGELTDRAKNEFDAANEAYKNGDFQTAVENYQAAIKKYPLHFGANINLALALLQADQAEDAFTQALACVKLFPDEGGALLNAQVTGVACGFSARTVNDTLNDIFDLEDGYSLTGTLANTELGQVYLYNTLWDNIDIDLHDDATGEDTDTELSYSYEELEEQMTQLEEDLPGDSDVSSLRTYFDAVGKQLGIVSYEDGSQ